MRRGNLGRLFGVTLSVLAVIGTVTSLPTVAQAATGSSPTVSPAVVSATPGCPSVELLGARGSGEPAEVNGQTVFGSLGPNVAQISIAFRKALGPQLSYGVVPISYPADGFEDLMPSPVDIGLLAAVTLPAPIGPTALATFMGDYFFNHWNKFVGSIQAGADEFVATATAEAVRCPKTALVLAGYSQGAMAAHDAEKMLSFFGKTDVLSHIASTILLADGDRVVNTTAHDGFGTSAASGQGVRTSLLLFVFGSIFGDVWDGPNTANICNAGDVVCDFSIPSLIQGGFSGAINTHTQYTICAAGVAQVCGTGAALSTGAITFVSPALTRGATFIGTKVAAAFPAITSTTAPVRQLGTGYTFGLRASGGQAPYRWSALDALPAGLTLAGATVSGTPRSTGRVVVRVQVTDARGRSATAAVTL